jgi:hypothetical protein
MAQNKLSGPGRRRPQLTWTDDMRLGLDLIIGLDISRAEKAAVFTRLFPDESTSGGYARGVPWGVLRSQLGDRKKNERASQAWNDLLARSSPSRRQSLKEHISTLLRERLVHQDDAPNISPITADTEPPALMLTRKRARHTERPAGQSATRSSKRIRVLDRVEIITPTIATATSLDLVEPSTPCRNPQDHILTTPATIRLERRIGPVLNLTPDKYAKLSEKYVQPSEVDLRLDPDDNLFFRYVIPSSTSKRSPTNHHRFFHDGSNGENSSSGFVAGRFAMVNGIPQDPPTMLDPADVWNHLNPSKERPAFPSPFVGSSTPLHR